MLPFLLALPFLGSAIYLLLPRHRLGNDVPWKVALAFMAGCLALLLWATLVPSPMGTRTFHAEWMPEIGLSFSLWLDGAALFFAWVVCGIGFLIFFYSGYYLDPGDSPWRFYGMMLLFTGSMLGVVMARNALLMFLFWELTSITSFILIGHWHERESARAGAMRALIVTGAGGLCLLAGIAAVFWVLRSSGVPAEAGIPLGELLNWDRLWELRAVLLAHPAASPIMALLLLGAFTKSAQFPFHFWLPGAMEAPTPVSAFLHAATMVKAGIYLLGRLYPIFWDQTAWLVVVGGIGILSMLVGGVMAILSHDLKLLLAHSTVSQLGLLTAYYGFGFGRVNSDDKLSLDLLLIASHALFKGALFMLIGVIDHGVHTRDWRRMGGLRRAMPVTSVMVIVGCASMAGVPLTFGFVAKELFLHMALHLDTGIEMVKLLLPLGAIAASMLTVAYSLRVAISPFFGKARDSSLHAHEGGRGLLAAPGLMIALCLVGGLYVPFLEGPIAAWENAAFFGTESGFSVAFFHKPDLLAAVAGMVFALGTAVFLIAARIDCVYTRWGRPEAFRRAYEFLFDRMTPAVSEWMGRMLQAASLQRNLLVVWVVILLAIIGAAGWEGYFPRPEIAFGGAELLGLLLAILVGVCLWVMLRHRVLLVRVVAFVPIGLFMTLLFVVFKAPDLALTEILVDVVLLVVILLLLIRLPQHFAKRSTRRGRLIRASAALTGGCVFGLLAWMGMTSEMRGTPGVEGWPTVREYYLQNTKHPYEDAAIGYPGWENPRAGGGNNAVNVVLVDFRGADTLGEITVLGIAALGVFCLLGMGRQRLDKSGELIRARLAVEKVHFGQPLEKPEHLQVHRQPSIILTEIGRLIPAFILVFSIVVLYAGHNAPGGGFISGLMVTVALATLYLSFARGQILSLHQHNYLKLIPIGLTIAIGTGLIAVVLGHPFLTSGYLYIHPPFVEELELASGSAFDLGVFFVVVGVSMLMLERLGRE